MNIATALQKLASEGLVQFPAKTATRGPLPVIPPEPYASLIKEWNAQKTFAQMCKKYGVNRHTAQSYLYGKRKK